MPKTAGVKVLIEASSNAKEVLDKDAKGFGDLAKGVETAAQQLERINKIPIKQRVPPKVGPGPAVEQPLHPPLVTGGATWQVFFADPQTTVALKEYNDLLESLYQKTNVAAESAKQFKLTIDQAFKISPLATELVKSSTHLNSLQLSFAQVTQQLNANKMSLQEAGTAYAQIANAADVARGKVNALGSDLGKAGAGPQVLEPIKAAYVAYEKLGAAASGAARKIEEKLSIAPPEIKKAPGFMAQLHGLSMKWMGLTMAMMGAQMAIQAVENAIKGMIAFGRLGAQAAQAEISFGRMTASVGISTGVLEELRSATNSTIDNLKLMQLTQTSLAGLTDKFGKSMGDALPKLAQIARAAHIANPALGDMDYMLQSLVVGLKRLSPRLIDNTGLQVRLGRANAELAAKLGKSTEELTAEEQQLALLNATIKAGDRLIEQIGGTTESLTDAYDQAAASQANLANDLSQTLSPAITEVIKLWQDLLNIMDFVVNVQNTSKAAFIEHAKAIAQSTLTQEEYTKEFYRSALAAGLSEEVSDAYYQEEASGHRVIIAGIPLLTEYERSLTNLDEAETRRTQTSIAAQAQQDAYNLKIQEAIKAVNALSTSLRDLTKVEFAKFAIEQLKALGEVSEEQAQKLMVQFGVIDQSVLDLQAGIKRIQDERGGIDAYMELFAELKAAAGDKAANEVERDLRALAAQMQAGIVAPEEYIAKLREVRSEIEKLVKVGTLPQTALINIDSYIKQAEQGADITKQALANLNDAKNDLASAQREMGSLTLRFNQDIAKLALDRDASLSKLSADFKQDALADETDLQRKLEEINQKGADQAVQIAQKLADQEIKIEENHRKTLETIERRYDASRMKALIDRDALALATAEETHDSELSEAEAKRKQDHADAKKDAVQSSQEAKKQAGQERRDAERDYQNKRQDRLAAFQQKQRDIQDSYIRELAQAQDQFNRERGLLSRKMYDAQVILNGGLTGQTQLIYNAQVAQIELYRSAYRQQQSDLINHLIKMNNIRSSMTGGGGGRTVYYTPGGVARYQQGGYVPGPPTQAVPATLHGGEVVVPADIVPALQRLVSGQMAVTLNVRGEGALAQMIREATYEAVIEVVS